MSETTDPDRVVRRVDLIVMPPCVWCGASRAEQAGGMSFYDAEGSPLCAVCWEAEYGDEYREKHGGEDDDAE